MVVTINKKDFIRVMKAIKPFTREADYFNKSEKMQYIHIVVDSENQEVKFEALDGHRFAIEYLDCNADQSFEAYVKPSSLWRTDVERVTISIQNNFTIVDFGWYSLKYELPVGEYYNLSTMVERANSNPVRRIGVNPQFMIDAMKNLDDSKGKAIAIMEVFEPSEPIIIRDKVDERNIRGILPIRIDERQY